MLLERIYDEDLAQASYMIGCQVSGEAIVVDPRRDIGVYLDLATRHGTKIVGVTETHIHADYLSGTRELAAATGATMYLSDEGGPEWTYSKQFAGATRLKGGDKIELGNITLEAVHTPGHTPEHLSFLVTDGAQATAPGYFLTGDFVFVGDLGRPDLLDEAAGGQDTRFVGASALFDSLRDRFLGLPDYVQVLPGHGSGSACGKALGAVPATTVGYEREFSWWAPYLQAGDREGFIEELLSGQPDAHAYFARMKRQNRDGPAVLGELLPLQEHRGDSLSEKISQNEVVFVDTRSHEEVRAGTVSGSLNIPGFEKTASYGAWAYDPELEQTPIVVLAATPEEAEKVRNHLIRVGIDTVESYVPSLADLPLTEPPVLHPSDLDSEEMLLFDVRNKTEFADGHIPGATQFSGGQALWRLDAIPEADTIYIYCQSGVRSSVVGQALRRAGYPVVELDGSFARWSEEGRAVEVSN